MRRETRPGARELDVRDDDDDDDDDDDRDRRARDGDRGRDRGDRARAESGDGGGNLPVRGRRGHLGALTLGLSREAGQRKGCARQREQDARRIVEKTRWTSVSDASRLASRVTLPAPRSRV